MTASRFGLRFPVRLGLCLGGVALAPAIAPAQAPAPKPGAGAPNVAAQAAAPAEPAFAATPAPLRPGLRAWTGDRRDFAVGDILTVLVDDYTISTAIKDDLDSQRRTRDLGFTITKPGAGLSTSAGVNSNNNADAENRGEARRENRFQSEMSVRVVAVAPNGTLQVKGVRRIDVDKGQQNVALAGYVRPQDVSAANTVESSRLADAQLTYQSPGPLGKPKQGLLTRVISIFWP
ncbi:hypothetical protein tb265_17430 [Gemmatimonadetes bacterium T265]|nr:hypothetical protein tb265_17430 [Gemmatimonadetes bacterium T265]